MAVSMKIGVRIPTNNNNNNVSLTFRRSITPFNCRIQFQFQLPANRMVVKSIKKSPKRLKYSTPRFNKDGSLLYVEVDPSGVDNWKLEPVIEQLKLGAVGVIPTDTVYAIVCDMNNHSAIERLRRIKDIDTTKPLGILCRSFHDIDVYTMGFPRGDNLGHPNIFRAIRQCLPGPYTFILTASKNLPRQCTNFMSGNAKYTPKKSIGVRLPDDPITKAILERMDSPLISTSVKSLEEDEWIMDPVVIADVYGKLGLDFVVDAGLRIASPSTVVDMTGNIPKIIRLGKGPRQPWMVSEDDEDEEF